MNSITTKAIFTAILRHT